MTEYYNKRDPKNRTFALSYAKDLAVAHIAQGKEYKTLDILKVAETFRQYMDGELNNVQALDGTE